MFPNSLIRYLDGLPNMKGKNLDEETVIRVAKMLGFEIAKDVYELWD